MAVGLSLIGETPIPSMTPIHSMTRVFSMTLNFFMTGFISLVSTLKLLFYGGYIILVARHVQVARFYFLYVLSPNTTKVLLEEAGAHLCLEKLDGVLAEPGQEYLGSFAIFH